MNFGFVPPPFGGLWSEIAGLLTRAMVRGGNSWRELEDGLADGRAQLWLAVTDRPVAAMVTRRDGETLEVWLAGGAVMAGCVPFLETAIAAAKADGATNGRITGRKGWQRVLAGFGWRKDGEDLVKVFS